MSRRRQRLLGLLFALLLAALLPLGWLLGSTSGLRWAVQQGQSLLPGELQLGQLEGRLLGPLTLSGLDYRQGELHVTAERLVFDWHPSALLAGGLDLSRLHITGLAIALPPPAPSGAQDGTGKALPGLELPLRLRLQDLRIDGLSLSQQDARYHLRQLRLGASGQGGRLHIEHLQLEADDASLQIDGDLHPRRDYAHDLNLAWTLRRADIPPLNGRGRLHGDLDHTRLTQQVSGPFELRLKAALDDLLGHPRWQAEVDVTHIDGRRLAPTLPAVSGRLQLQGEGDLETAQISGSAEGRHPEWGPFDGRFRLRRVADAPLIIDQLLLHAPALTRRLEARGTWQPGADGGHADLALTWQGLRWPAQGRPWFDSAVGSAWLVGSLAHYQLGLATSRPWAEAPPSDWYASASGDDAGMTVHALRVALLGGQALARGRLDWADHFRWQAEAEAQAIDPAGLLAEWPGRLDARLRSRGELTDGGLTAQAEIQQLRGQLRGYPVSLHGRLGWRAAGLDVETLALRSGRSRLDLQGRLGERLALQWSLDSPALEELYPGARGRLEAQGRLSGPRATPIVEARLDGQELGLGEYHIGRLTGRLAVQPTTWQRFEVDLRAQALRLAGVALNDLHLVGQGSDGRQRLRVAARAAEAEAVLVLSGRGGPQAWQGRLEQADIDSRRFADWRLQAPAEVRIEGQSLHTAPLCWNSHDARLCLTLARAQARWQAGLEAKGLPLGLLTPVLPAGLVLEGRADAQAEFQLLPPQRLRGTLHLALPGGALRYPVLEGEVTRWDYRSGRLNLVLDDQGLRAEGDMAMHNGDHFQGRLALPGAELLALAPEQQPLQASAELSLHRLGLIEALLPDVQDLHGEFRARLRASGSLAQPRLSGEANLRNAALRVPRLGIGLEQVSLTAQSEGFERLQLHLAARSGGGLLEVEGETRLSAADGWPTQLQIKGQAVEVAHIPEAQVRVSPDLRVHIVDHRIQVEGTLHVPFARLQPKDISLAAKPSPDVVVIGGPPARPEAEKWAITTRVRLSLGERVSFYGFGFEGRFSGELLLEDTPGQPTRATGKLKILEGRYRAYGQRLDVEQGRLLFAGGPVDNPGLDLRAVRHVGEVTAGLKVRGSLQRPQLELFSIPAMGQTDALAYLLLGHPIEGSSESEGSLLAKAALALGLSGGDRLARSLAERFGLDEMRIETGEREDQAALVMGRYLSPRLYVGYGIGLLGSANTLTLRYQLSKQWQLKGESGEQVGADLIYTIER